MYKWTLYDHGRALQSAFWRNDAAVMRLAGAADLPHDLYPDSVPWVAFLRVLSAPRDGSRRYDSSADHAVQLRWSGGLGSQAPNRSACRPVHSLH